MNLVLTLHDPEGSMLEQAARVLDAWKKLFTISVIAYTKQTHVELVHSLHTSGMQMIEGGLWGEGRTKAVTFLHGLGTHESTLIMDFDKLIHILDFCAAEFMTFVRREWPVSTMIGRTKKAWETFPQSWKQTETVANMLGNRSYETTDRDYLLGTFVLNPAELETIANHSVATGFDAVFEWITLLGGKKLAYVDSDLFDWEDPDRNLADIDKLGPAEWERVRFDSIAEWKKRIKNLQDIVAVLK